MLERRVDEIKNSKIKIILKLSYPSSPGSQNFSWDTLMYICNIYEYEVIYKLIVGFFYAVNTLFMNHIGKKNQTKYISRIYVKNYMQILCELIYM